jgi:transketolase
MKQHDSSEAKSIRQQFADTMLEMGKSDSELVVIVGDISHGILQPFAKACAGRYYNAGIMEPTLMSMAAGLSSTGLRPVLHTIAPFLIERAFEQIKLDFVYHQLPGNIVTVGSAFDYSNLGCTHHCYGDFGLLRTLPGVQILYPGSAMEFDILFKQAYANSQLTYYRLPAESHAVELESAEIEVGRAVLVASGDDLTIVATGPQLDTAVGVRGELSKKGVDAEILYVHTIRPLDRVAITNSVGKTGKVLVIEEHMKSGGLGDEVLGVIGETGGVPFRSCSIPDTFVRGYGSYRDHCETVGLTVDGVLEVIHDAGW